MIRDNVNIQPSCFPIQNLTSFELDHCICLLRFDVVIVYVQQDEIDNKSRELILI